MRMLDLFCGRFGWSKAFAARGWECIGIDLVEPPEIPEGCTFIKFDILKLSAGEIKAMGVDFVCASSPCEQFSIWGLPHFHPNPPYPELGIKLFEHTRVILEESGLPYVMENVKAAQRFVGKSQHKCGPFHLWGNAIPPLMPQGIQKGVKMGSGSAVRGMTPEEKRLYRKQFPELQVSGTSAARKAFTAKWATIPPELSNCVGAYAERILEPK